MLAASAGDAEMVGILLEAGADINALNRVGQSAISRAAYFGHQEVVKLLVFNKADANVTDTFYRITPMLSAALGGDPEIGRMLATRGAEIDAQDGNQPFIRTPTLMV